MATDSEPLERFILDVEKDMRLVCVDKTEVFFRSHELRKLAKEAFRELAKGNTFQKLSTKVVDLARDLRESFGLMGYQLAFKLRVFYAKRRRFYRFFRGVLGRLRTVLVREKVIQFMRELLKSAEPILETMVDVAGLGHAIVELKDSAENGMS